MRYDCDDPAFAGNFIEFSDAWSRREMAESFKATGDEWLALMLRKISALHLETLEGEALDDPAQLAGDALDGLDLRLFMWVTGVFAKVRGDIGELGEALRRRLFDSSAAATAVASPTP